MLSLLLADVAIAKLGAAIGAGLVAIGCHGTSARENR